MALSKSVDAVYAQSVIPCSVCDDVQSGQRYCIECKQTLCTKCAKSHRMVASYKEHNIILRAQVGDIKYEVLVCTDHEELASVHCETCNIPICIQCVTGNHQGHKMVQLSDIADEKKKFLQKSVDELQKNILPELLTKKREILEEKEKYETTFQEHIHDVEKEKENLLRGIDLVYKDNLKSLQGTRQSDLLVFEESTKEVDTKIQICEKRISEFQDIIKKNNLSTIINITLEHESKLEAGNEPEYPMPPGFVASNVENIIDSVRKLRFNCPSPTDKTAAGYRSPVVISSFKSPVKGGTAIAITNEGCVWLGGADAKELIKVNLIGETLRKRKVQNWTNGLAVLHCGNFIISPRGYVHSPIPVKILTDRGEFSITNSCSTFGVSVTPDQRILICSQGGQVAKMDEDGTNFKEVYIGSGFRCAYHAIENVDGKTFISDMKNSKVVVLDKTGSVVSELKKTLSGKKLGKPAGLVLDKNGNIFLADKGNDCVYIIDQNQQIQELVGRSHGIRKPRFLAFDDKGHLWISSFNETIIIVKFLEEY